MHICPFQLSSPYIGYVYAIPCEVLVIYLKLNTNVMDQWSNTIWSTKKTQFSHCSKLGTWCHVDSCSSKDSGFPSIFYIVIEEPVTACPSVTLMSGHDGRLTLWIHVDFQLTAQYGHILTCLVEKKKIC